MNTKQKGDLFEERVFEILNYMILSNSLFVSSEKYNIFRQKAYFSQQRQSDIKFDISVECFRKDSKSPGFYILVECKDYNSPISVKILEEFLSKKNQVAMANSKCMLFVTSAVQKAAFNFANSNGIAIIRLFDDDSMTWLIERSSKAFSTTESNTKMLNVINALTTDYFITTTNVFFAMDKDHPFLNIDELITYILHDCNWLIEE